MGYQPEDITPAEAGLTIAERVALGRETDSAHDGAIVPTRTSFANIPLPHALSGKQRTDISRLLFAGYTETRHIYRAPDGVNIAAVVRLEKAGGDKTFRPLRFLGRDKEGHAIYDLTAVPAPRPFYNLDAIHARPGDPVLVVEGEKAADAAARRFPHVVATTWMSGVQSVAQADVRDLAGRDVVLWGDNDKAGRSAVIKIAPRLLGVGCVVRVVQVPEDFPDKYDLGDPDPDGATGDRSPEALLANAITIDPATAAAMLRGSTRALRALGLLGLPMATEQAVPT